MTQDAKQFNRQVSLVVSGSTGDGLDLSAMRVTFDIKKGDVQTPNSATIKVYNLSKDTENRIENEFTRIILQAGYPSNIGVIFSGNIKKVSYGRENSTDSYISMTAGDGDQAYNYSIVNKSLISGASQDDQINASIDSMTGAGVSRGYIANTGGEKLPRGKVMYGMSRDYLRQSALTSNTSWSIQDGKVQFLENTGLLPGQGVSLTSETGLIGFPEKTDNGININCLLNPLIRVGGSVKIDNSKILDTRTGETEEEKKGTKSTPEVNTDRDGVYRVLVAEYVGDTHGNDWFCKLTCLAVNSSARQNEQVQPT